MNEIDKKILKEKTRIMFDFVHRDCICKKLGKEMFRLFTEKGLPIEIFFDEINKKFNFSLTNKLCMYMSYSDLKWEHDFMNSGKLVNDKWQERNKKTFYNLLMTGQLD